MPCLRSSSKHGDSDSRSNFWSTQKSVATIKMVRGREIFFSLSILKEETPPSLRRYVDEKGRGENPIKENRFLISLGASAVGFSSPLFFFSFSVSLSFSFFVGEEYGDACDVLGSTARSMSIACTYIYECNVDRCMIGYVNDAEDILLHAIHWFHLLGIACPRSNSSLC